jgi:hypothetical protein
VKGCGELEPISRPPRRAESDLGPNSEIGIAAAYPNNRVQRLWGAEQAKSGCLIKVDVHGGDRDRDSAH